MVKPKLKNITSWIVLLLPAILPLSAQERFGITPSNYYCSSGIFLNPASSVDSKTYMQLNVAGAGAFFYNNMFYLPKYTFWKSGSVSMNTLAGSLNKSQYKKFLFASGSADGPSFVMNREHLGFGLFMRARMVVDARSLPNELVELLFTNNKSAILNQGSVNVKSLKLSAMSWMEFGANIAAITKKQDKDMWIFGANIRYLSGLSIMYAHLANLNGSLTDTAFSLNTAEARLRYNKLAINSGKGGAVDVGLTYKKMLKSVTNYYPNSPKSSCQHIDYKYKASAVLRDLGVIQFSKGANLVDANSSGNIAPGDLLNNSQYDIQNKLGYTAFEGPVYAVLPTNLSAQFDWNFENHIYLSGTLVKNLVWKKLTGVGAMDVLSVSPRMEYKNWEVAMPLAFQKFIHPQLGVAARYRGFAIGFDNLFPLFLSKPKTYGVGVYFNLVASLYKNPACSSGLRKQRAVRCAPKHQTAHHVSLWRRFVKKR